MEKILMNRKVFLYTILVLILLLIPHNTKAVELITNGGFETGNFTGWTTVNGINPWYPWQVVTAGFNNGFMPSASPQDGTRVAYQGVAADAGGTFTLTQDVAIPSGTTASLRWKHRFQLDLMTYCSGALCGTGIYTVDVLNTSNILLVNLLTVNVASEQYVDTGWQTFQRSLNAFAGQTVRIRFRTTVSASYQGPGQLEIDAVSLQSPSLIPTAANVSVGGKVITAEGAGISRSTVTLTNSAGVSRSATTNSFGNYGFDEVPAGETYILTVNNKKYFFADSPRVLNVQDNLADIDFVASP
jgi:hypothetical protein